MSIAESRLFVKGDAVSAWLIASVVVRFCGIEPRNLVVNDREEWKSDTVFVRPETTPLLKSIGLDAARLPGSKNVNAWVARDKTIPLSPFGVPLRGSAFQNFWSRAKKESKVGSLWSYCLNSTVSDCFSVPAKQFVEAVKNIAISVGVPSCGDLNDQTQLTITSAGSIDESDFCGNTIHVGNALSEIGILPDLQLYALDISLRALIANWPRPGTIGPEIQEYHRRTYETYRHFDDLRALLDGDTKSRSNLSHRIDVWRELGRITPVDGDPFKEQEWIGALLHAGHEPVGYPLLLDAVSKEDVRHHLSKCALRASEYGVSN